MTYKIGLQTEFFENSNANNVSSLLLALEAQKRGYQIFHFSPDSLSYYNNEVIAWVRPLTISDNQLKSFVFGEYERILLKTLDIIIMRQERPYNLKYLTNCRLLEKVAQETLVINNPSKIQKASDNWFVTAFPEITPPTLISSDVKEIKAFRAEHKDVILKPLYSRHGEGKYHLTSESENIDSYLEMFAKLYDQMIIAQKFIAGSHNRKIVVIEGKPVGAYDQPVSLCSNRAKIKSDLTTTKAVMSKRDYEICEHLAPVLNKMDITIALIEVIGDYLIEIDINSPIGFEYISQFDGVNVADYFWNAVLKKLK